MKEFVIRREDGTFTSKSGVDPIISSLRYVWGTAREANAQLELWRSQSAKREAYLEGMKVYEVLYLEVV